MTHSEVLDCRNAACRVSVMDITTATITTNTSHTTPGLLVGMNEYLHTCSKEGKIEQEKKLKVDSRYEAIRTYPVESTSQCSPQ